MRARTMATGRFRLALVVVCVSAAIATPAMQPAPGAVTSACHVSPIVSDLDKSAHFYHDVIGLDLVPTPGSGPLPWDKDPGYLNLHGLPNARLRFIGARMPGVFCGVELVEFASAEQRRARRRLQDPGAAMLILLVRDIDAIFSRLKAAGTVVVTTGGAPIFVGPSKTARAIIVEDPDGHPIELAQLEPAPPTTAAADSNVIGIRLRITVKDSEIAATFYHQALGIEMKPGVFTKDESVMAMMGFPATAEYRVATSTLPDSMLVLELIEFKGAGPPKSVASRVQDTGSYRLQLNVRDIDKTLSELKQAGSRVISTNGSPVSMTLGSSPWRLAVVQDPNDLFLVVQQRLAR
jgi:catechol 2,3-dioxygenase-like lactoylglutathione lyase family enzyme